MRWHHRVILCLLRRHPPLVHRPKLHNSQRTIVLRTPVGFVRTLLRVRYAIVTEVRGSPAPIVLKTMPHLTNHAPVGIGFCPLFTVISLFAVHFYCVAMRRASVALCSRCLLFKSPVFSEMPLSQRVIWLRDWVPCANSRNLYAIVLGWVWHVEILSNDTV